MSPMPPETVPLIEELRDYMIANTLGRKPSIAGAEPPVWLAPALGTPAPGESPSNEPAEVNAELVLGLFSLPGPPTAAYEGPTWRREIIDIRIRCKHAPTAHDFAAAIRPHLHDRRNYMLAGRRIIESKIVRELAPLGSSEQGYTFSLNYLFELYLTNP